MAMMYGVNTKDTNEFADATTIRKVIPKNKFAEMILEDGKKVKIGEDTFTVETDSENANAPKVTYYDEKGAVQVSKDAESVVYAVVTLKVEGTEIRIGADNFPGNYYVTGDTYARSEVSGKDEYFQFIIPKAKMQSEVTLTMEAEGDPSTFNMNLKVLRPADGNMMKLVKYGVTAEG